MKKIKFILLVLVFSLSLPFPGLIPIVSGMPNVTIIVTIQTDTVNGSDGECSLREAIIAAYTDTASGHTGDECSAGNGVDTIIVPIGRHLIQMAGDHENYAATGDLDVRESVNIYGLGKDLSIIDANIADRIFHVPPDLGDITLRFADLTLTEGIMDNGDDSGGAVKSESGRLEAEDVIFKNNFVGGTESGANGGAVHVKNELQIVNCLFENNYAYRGGALFIAGGVTEATIEKSLFLKNNAQSGGAMINYGETTIENTTFSQNKALQSGGGAIYNFANLSISFSTFVGNASTAAVGIGQAGAIYNASSASIGVNSTILAGNSASTLNRDNCNQGGTWLASNFNLEDDDTCPFGATNFYNTDPKLAPLGFWGGPTQTYPVLYDSQAIDSGGNTNCPSEDQRSVGRPIDGNGNAIATCDIGAFEAESSYSMIYLPLAIK